MSAIIALTKLIVTLYKITMKLGETTLQDVT